MSAVGQTDLDGHRYYVDPANPDRVFESVTSILAMTRDTAFLAPWAAKLTAEYTVENIGLVLDHLAALGEKATIGWLKTKARELREIKADIGSHQHAVLEALLLDQPIPALPEHLVGVEVDGDVVDHDAISTGLLNFITDHDVVPELAEATVASSLHRHAGTLDLIARIRGLGLFLIDCKTGKNLSDDVAAQLAGYRYSDEVWLDAFGNKQPMPHVDGCAVLHVRRTYRRGYKLLKVEAGPDQYRAFLAMHRALRARESLAKVHGVPLYPPLPDGSQPAPMVEDIDRPDGWARARTALTEANLDRLDLLTLMNEADVTALRGIGPKSLHAIKAVMAEFGLALSDDHEAKVA